jgi:glutathione S-transferase
MSSFAAMTAISKPAGRPHLLLVSHALCPYVQRAAIVLAEKGAAFERRDLDLAAKPQWFVDISPLGKTPVLLVDGRAVFESSVICEYLEDTIAPPLHPADPLERAVHRGWMEFGSQVLNAIAGLYSARDATALSVKSQGLAARFTTLEKHLSCSFEPYFAGERFCMVDAAFGPVFRYFDVLDSVQDFGGLAALPKVGAWRKALAARHSVEHAVAIDYAERLCAFLLARNSELGRQLALKKNLQIQG